jgi:ubiquinone/menaquinone biosynthesis C-methylase UbiE
LFEYLKDLNLTLVDTNKSMLEQASNYLRRHGVNNFRVIRASASQIPLRKKSMTCLFSFNAIHHFQLPTFFSQAEKIVKDGGSIFIYTRLPSQNARNIWGRFFPKFKEKENRLYKIDQLRQAVKSTRRLSLVTIKSFKYYRQATLEQLLQRISSRHYSTFSLYQRGELAECTKTFKDNICKHFQNPECIEWFDENIMLYCRPNLVRLQ